MPGSETPRAGLARRSLRVVAGSPLPHRIEAARHERHHARSMDGHRYLSHAQLDALISAAAPATVQESIFRRFATGWRRVTRAQAADASYRRFWSEAVLCVSTGLPGVTA